MKTAIIITVAGMSLAAIAYLLHRPDLDGGAMSHTFMALQGQSADNSADTSSGPVTVSMAQNDFDLCRDDFYIGFYELTSALYANREEAVTVAELENTMFSYIRSYPALSEAEAEAWVEHIDLIPGQLVDIIAEDPAVIESCANYSVALVGPP